MSLADEKYVALTTFKRDGSSTSVPVWIADFGDGRLCFTTGTDTLKARRVAHDARVQLQPSNARGAVKDGTVAASGTAELVPAGSDAFATAQAAIRSKYGYQVTLAQWYYKLTDLVKRTSTTTGDCALVITVD
ncbi:MAG: pyridoxamine 5'-phosphate oxidase family protein [Acidimicrobiia bacterium]|nr:pyridoxamine 5'-phosphate oxidase family protein [Acidimicrobiia bacterium]